MRGKHIVSFVLSAVIACSAFLLVPKTIARAANIPSVSYTAYVQRAGWMGNAVNGALSGTTGKSLRLQAFKVSLSDASGENASITYQAYMQSYGWRPVVADGETAGITDKAKRMEAVRIAVSDLSGHAVQYRVYQQSYGWGAWKTSDNDTEIENAPVAGVTGKSKRIEAIEIKLIATGETATGSDSDSDSGSSGTDSGTDSGSSNLSGMTDSEFQSYLNSNYGSLTIDGKSVSFTWKVNQFASGNTSETITANLNPDQYLNWLSWISAGKQTDIKTFFGEVASDTKTKYPGKTFFGDIIYQDEYSFYPSSYDYDEVTYDSVTGKWLITHTVADFYSFDGSTISTTIK